MATEDFQRSLTVAADPDATWSCVTDVDRLAAWLGILHDVREIERLVKYEAVLQDRVGPFRLRADLAIDVQVPVEGFRVEISASGHDRAVDSKISITAALELSASDEGTTLALAGRYQVSGRVASMGGGVIRKKAELVLRDFFVNAGRELGAPSPASS